MGYAYFRTNSFQGMMQERSILLQEKSGSTSCTGGNASKIGNTFRRGDKAGDSREYGGPPTGNTDE